MADDTATGIPALGARVPPVARGEGQRLGLALLVISLTQLAPRAGPRVPITIGAVLAPAGMFWLSRVHEHSQYLTGVCLPMLVFAAAAGLIFVPLTTILVAGISDEHAGIASSMFNAGQQAGGAVGLAVIGSAAWTTISGHLRNTHGARGYGQALASGVTEALTIGAAVTVLALIITVMSIRARP